MFKICEAAQGILHVQDALGVSFTLLKGKDRGLLIDTGYGLENVRAFVEAHMNVPYEVLLTHGHHDHILGAPDFARVFLCGEDREEYDLRSGTEQRQKIIDRAREAGIAVPETYLSRKMPEPEKLLFSGQRGKFESRTEDLGGMTAEIIHVPGHTPGSVVIWIPEARILLTGDNWNPCTWLWFPSSIGIEVWKDHMMALMKLPFERVLCSHQPGPWNRQDLQDYLDWLTESVLDLAPKISMGSSTLTHCARWNERGFEIVFDEAKRRKQTLSIEET